MTLPSPSELADKAAREVHICGDHWETTGHSADCPSSYVYDEVEKAILADREAIMKEIEEINRVEMSGERDCEK